VITTQIPTASRSQGQPISSLPPPQSDTETAEQTQIASPTHPAPESSPDDAPDQFIVAHRTPVAGSSASSSSDPFWSLMPKGGESM
jgi:hypothetical protein